MTGPGPRADREALAVVVARDGTLPAGADEAVAEAGGAAAVVGTGSERGGRSLVGAEWAWWAETGAGLQPAALAARLAPVVAGIPLLILPASPDGRDLAPRLAAALGRPLVSRAVRVDVGAEEGPDHHPRVRALVARLDDRVLLPVDVDGPAVVTLVPGSRSVEPGPTAPVLEPLPDATRPGTGPPTPPDPQVTAILEPDPHTIDLAEATRVVAGGAGLATGADDRRAVEIFALLGEVAAAMGGSAGATRVATDAGWTGYERQIGTTGVTIDPDLYIAFGVSGAAQHIGGLGTPRHIVSINTDPSSPMTAMADLGLVTDAQGLLVELGRRWGVAPADDGPSPRPQPVGSSEPAGG